MVLLVYAHSIFVAYIFILKSIQIGVGGLDHVFAELFRRVLTPRLMSPELRAALPVRAARGVLLHGPPGTGKTLVSNSISSYQWFPMFLNVPYA